MTAHQPARATFKIIYPDWMADARCGGFNDDTFYPSEQRNRWDDGEDSVADAKLICRRCPVQDKCLDYALKTGDVHGIYGGLTGKERKNMRRRTRRNGAA